MVGNPRDWAPATGSTPWEQEAARYEQALNRQRRERWPPKPPRRRRLRWIITPLVIVGCVLLIGLATDPSREDANGVSADTSTSGPESISDNSEHPPQADLNGDTSCGVDNLGFVTATGTLTNHSSKTSFYDLQVSFNDAAGVRFAEAPVFHSDVRAGETVMWDANGLTRPPSTPWTCEVVSVERFSFR